MTKPLRNETVAHDIGVAIKKINAEFQDPNYANNNPQMVVGYIIAERLKDIADILHSDPAILIQNIHK